MGKELRETRPETGFTLYPRPRHRPHMKRLRGYQWLEVGWTLENSNLCILARYHHWSFFWLRGWFSSLLLPESIQGPTKPPIQQIPQTWQSSSEFAHEYYDCIAGDMTDSRFVCQMPARPQHRGQAGKRPGGQREAAEKTTEQSPVTREKVRQFIVLSFAVLVLYKYIDYASGRTLYPSITSMITITEVIILGPTRNWPYTRVGLPCNLFVHRY